MAQVVIDVNDFMDHLKDNNLVIVHKDELRIKQLIEERQLQKTQAKLLKQKSIKPSEAIKYKLVKDKQAHGLVGWVKRNYPEALFVGASKCKEIAMYAIIERRINQNII